MSRLARPLGLRAQVLGYQLRRPRGAPSVAVEVEEGLVQLEARPVAVVDVPVGVGRQT